MSHLYTQHEEDNAKIQYLQFKLGDNRVPADVLYKEAINILEGQPIDHHVVEGEGLVSAGTVEAAENDGADSQLVLAAGIEGVSVAHEEDIRAIGLVHAADGGSLGDQESAHPHLPLQQIGDGPQVLLSLGHLIHDRIGATLAGQHLGEIHHHHQQDGHGDHEFDECEAACSVHGFHGSPCPTVDIA